MMLWLHLKQSCIHNITAEIGLLIGKNIPNAMEPEKVIKSINDGPYTVRTVRGWTVNGPLRDGKYEETRDEVTRVY